MRELPFPPPPPPPPDKTQADTFSFGDSGGGGGYRDATTTTTANDVHPHTTTTKHKCYHLVVCVCVLAVPIDPLAHVCVGQEGLGEHCQEKIGVPAIWCQIYCYGTAFLEKKRRLNFQFVHCVKMEREL